MESMTVQPWPKLTLGWPLVISVILEALRLFVFTGSGTDVAVEAADVVLIRFPNFVCLSILSVFSIDEVLDT